MNSINSKVSLEYTEVNYNRNTYYLHPSDHLSIYTHTHTHTRHCIQTHTHMHTRMHAYTYIHTYIHTIIHTYTHILISYIHTYTHTHARTHARTHAHTCTCTSIFCCYLSGVLIGCLLSFFCTFKSHRLSIVIWRQGMCWWVRGKCVK